VAKATCEDSQCRGNAPCSECLTALHIAIWKGLELSLGGTDRRPDANVVKWFMDSVKIELERFRAKTPTMKTGTMMKASPRESEPTSRPRSLKDLLAASEEVTGVRTKKGKKR
jgi:hypothetical protein